MKALFLSLSVLCTSVGFGQSTPSKHTIDLNGDGVKETITVKEESGSSMGSIDVTIKDGKTKQVNTLSIDQNFSSLYHHIAVPEWAKRHNYQLNQLAPLIGYTPKEKLSPSLAWLLSAEVTPLTEEKFDQQITYPVQWHSKALWEEEPSSAALVLTPKAMGLKAAELKESDQPAWVLFNEGNVQTKFSSRKRDLDYLPHFEKDPVSGHTVTAFSHGVYVEDDKGNFSWVFICDDHIEDGHGKLRDNGVYKARIKGDRVVIKYMADNSETFLYLVDYKTGVIKRIRPSGFGIEKIDDFILFYQSLVIESEGKRIDLPF